MSTLTTTQLEALMLDVGRIVGKRLDGLHPEAALCVAGFVATCALKCWNEPERSRVTHTFVAQLLERVQQLDNQPRRYDA